MVAVPRLYERLYARVHLDRRGRRRPPPADLPLGDAASAASHYQNHLDGAADSAWLSLQLAIADRLVFHKIRARTGGRVRYFVSGGAPLSREIGEFFYAMGMLILEGYGLTETAPLLSLNRPERLQVRHRRQAGRRDRRCGSTRRRARSWPAARRSCRAT